MKNENLTGCHIEQPTSNETLNSASRSSRRQSTEKCRKVTQRFKLLAVIFWVCLSGVSYGQFIVDASNSPLEWSDLSTNDVNDPNDILEIENKGILIKNGGEFKISFGSSAIKDIDRSTKWRNVEY
jgi:hypothetical protein